MEMRCREFPVMASSTFLAHAGVCPLPRCVTAAMFDYLERCHHGDQETAFPEGLLTRTRQLTAELLACRREEIAMVAPTSLGLSIVANGLDWQSGDNVIFYPEDFPSNVVVWRALEARGVELREIQTPNLGAITQREILPLMDKRTRLVALTSAHYISGQRIDLHPIGKAIHERGALLCVDGIQTLGAFHTSIEHADFLATDAHKWLLGPCAAGILFIRREVQERLRPTILGWNNVHSPHYIGPKTLQFPSHAGRYEAGTHNLVGIAGLHAALELLQKVGAQPIEEILIEHARFLRQELHQRNFQVAGLSDCMLSGITSFTDPKRDMPTLHQKLTEAKIITSLRQTRNGTPWIRISPHFYNNRGDLVRLLEVMDATLVNKHSVTQK